MNKLSKVALTFSILGMSVAGFVAQSHEAKAYLYFANCKEAWQAGYANIPEGAEGYRPGLDRNHNGEACDIENAGGYFIPRVENPAPDLSKVVVEENPVTEDITAVNTATTSQENVPTVETPQEGTNTNVTAPVVKELPKTSAVK